MFRNVYVLDKSFPPKHSFVDGYILKSENNPIIVCSKGVGNINSEYKGIDCYDILYERKGIYRILNFFVLFFFLFKLSFVLNIKKLIIRNDPLYLLSGYFIFKFGKVGKLIFQNSFPHENFGHGFIKEKLAKKIFKYIAKKCYKVIVVSSLASVRMQDYGVEKDKIQIVPLCVDDEYINDFAYDYKKGRSINIIYIGSHDEDREIDFIINLISEVINENYLMFNNVKISFIGGSCNDMHRVKSNLNSLSLKYLDDKIFLKQKIDRDDVKEVLKESHIGISIIPPKKYFIEASPTKLTEYLGSGMLVWSNSEIIEQDSISKLCSSCLSSKYESSELKNTLIKAIKMARDDMENNFYISRNFVRDNYNYSKIKI